MKAHGTRRWKRLLAASGALLTLGGCPLTDQQITAIAQSVISTGLNTLVSNVLQSLLTLGDAGATG